MKGRVAELVVVLPVFNEEASVERVIREWIPVFDALQTGYGVLALDDGSTDGTPEIPGGLQREFAALEMVRHVNRGHGQTVFAGYRLACARGARFVFQMDSDGQCDPRFFPALWAGRAENDVMYGCRVDRRDGWRRKLASRLLRAVVRVCSGVSCEDANTPFRLMRTDGLAEIVEKIPRTFDLANIGLAVLLKRAGWRHGGVPIRFRERFGGESKVPLARFARKAVELTGDLRRLHRENFSRSFSNSARAMPTT